MSLFEVLRVAVRSLRRSLGRSFLTTLGIMIGIGAVIAMVSVGEGARAKVRKAFDAMGTNLLIVRSASTSAGGAHGGWGSMPSLTWEDLKAIQELSAVRYVAPRPEVSMQLVGESANWNADVGGVTPEFFLIREWPVALGEPLTQADVDTGAKVIILGETVVTKLYGEGKNPVGREVHVGNQVFTIKGVLTRKGQSPNGGDIDDNTYVPISTYTRTIQGGLSKYVNGNIFVSAMSAGDTGRAERQITELLRERHAIRAGADDDFQIRNNVETASARDEGARALTLLLGGVAAVSLIVAGIGIMNIMLVTVTERTREIGVRLAVGAKPRHILLQFLVESLTLSTIGGLLGVALGVVFSQRMAASSGWPLLLELDAILLAVVFSAVVGLVFGLYPAWRAARLDPIEALRFES